MKNILLVFLGTVAVVLLYILPVNAAATAKVTARIVGEDGIPIKNADVTVGYTLAKKGGWGTDDKRVEGKSDRNGLFAAKGDTIIPQVTIHAQHEGYYKSSKWAKFTSRSKLLNRWEPWNPTVEVVLKKKRNPVAMYKIGTQGVKVASFGEKYGFDLEKRDWVSPYGKGVFSDFVIQISSTVRAYTDYECEMTLSFSNPNDGIQEYFFDSKEQSYYKWPFEAPLGGYMKELLKERSNKPGRGYRSNEKQGVNYIFRVRTKVDKDGNIILANYGKINGEFGFDPDGEIVFFYYFNPDGTRNLEHDPDKNLFKKKKSTSRSRRRR